ncbi:phage integrase family protein (plasmid) [Calothrix sp. NIES-4071]|nr:phage integrase family protein [Calothrix sp. NIES-4071]
MEEQVTNQAMKIQRNGQAEVLSEEQFAELMEVLSPADKLLFGICYYTSCRISEALQLRKEDIVGERLLFRARNTKNKRTKEIKIGSKLAQLMREVGLPKSGYLFPSRNGKSYKSRQAADLALRKACDYIGLQGISTHTFRRTSLTKLYRAGVPLPLLQKRSGHASPANLVLYLDIDRDEVDAAGELL